MPRKRESLGWMFANALEDEGKINEEILKTLRFKNVPQHTLLLAFNKFLTDVASGSRKINVGEEFYFDESLELGRDQLDPSILADRLSGFFTDVVGALLYPKELGVYHGLDASRRMLSSNAVESYRALVDASAEAAIAAKRFSDQPVLLLNMLQRLNAIGATPTKKGISAIDEATMQAVQNVVLASSEIDSGDDISDENVYRPRDMGIFRDRDYIGSLTSHISEVIRRASLNYPAYKREIRALEFQVESIQGHLRGAFGEAAKKFALEDMAKGSFLAFQNYKEREVTRQDLERVAQKVDERLAALELKHASIGMGGFSRKSASELSRPASGRSNPRNSDVVNKKPQLVSPDVRRRGYVGARQEDYVEESALLRGSAWKLVGDSMRVSLPPKPDKNNVADVARADIAAAERGFARAPDRASTREWIPNGVLRRFDDAVQPNVADVARADIAAAERGFARAPDRASAREWIPNGVLRRFDDAVQPSRAPEKEAFSSVGGRKMDRAGGPDVGRYGPSSKKALPTRGYEEPHLKERSVIKEGTVLVRNAIATSFSDAFIPKNAVLEFYYAPKEEKFARKEKKEKGKKHKGVVGVRF